MNYLTNVKNLQKINERELQLGLTGQDKSWHSKYKNSAWIYFGGVSFDLTEGDLLCVFSQYGEIVNINLVRDKKTGKSRGYGFLCYEDQRSTILSVDNLNGIKLCNRIIRVDHVENYRPPKESEEYDELTKLLHEKGCAPEVIHELQQNKVDGISAEGKTAREDVVPGRDEKAAQEKAEKKRLRREKKCTKKVRKKEKKALKKARKKRKRMKKAKNNDKEKEKDVDTDKDKHSRKKYSSDESDASDDCGVYASSNSSSSDSEDSSLEAQKRRTGGDPRKSSYRESHSRSNRHDQSSSSQGSASRRRYSDVKSDSYRTLHSGRRWSPESRHRSRSSDRYHGRSRSR
ncbi:RNA-binding motif protein, X-linked 2-like isoform X2 [Varroa destructor]|uniref:RRM domain-containing protein n=1 Tax=Varroa destructor TaxID=109461 RepID=A0A7M7K498_VARDE|nr:RNA-binding motif protein, X-linked 2-like isoform X2 [Varroa destructor]